MKKKAQREKPHIYLLYLCTRLTDLLHPGGGGEAGSKKPRGEQPLGGGPSQGKPSAAAHKRGDEVWTSTPARSAGAGGGQGSWGCSSNIVSFPSNSIRCLCPKPDKRETHTEVGIPEGKERKEGEVVTFTDFPSQAGKTRFFPTGCFSSLCVFFTFTESASLLTFPVVECVKVFPHTKQFSLTPGCPAISLNSGTVYTEMASDSTG